MNNTVFEKKRKPAVFRKALYIVNIVIAFIKNCFIKKQNEKVWLIGLGDDLYSNNGRVFYEYIKKEHSEIDIFWVCEKDSLEYLQKFIPSDNLIVRGSVKNYVFILKAEVAMYGFSDYDIAPGFFRIIKKHKVVVVNLGHGFDGLKGMPHDYYKKIYADIICAASIYELNMKIKKCGANENSVKLTGFARYDKWPIPENNTSAVNKIFIMPTWRDWYEKQNINWEDSELYKIYAQIFDFLENLASDTGFEVVYKFHPRMKAFFQNAGWNTYDYIHEASDSDEIQQLIITSDIIITDYSSVFWDAVYMKKKTMLFWFDEDEYRKERGLLATENFYSNIARNYEEFCGLLNKFIHTSNDELVDIDLFDWRDNHHCDRIFDEIERAIENRKGYGNAS